MILKQEHVSRTSSLPKIQHLLIVERYTRFAVHVSDCPSEFTKKMMAKKTTVICMKRIKRKGQIGVAVRELPQSILQQ